MDLVALKARKLESARKSCSSQTLAIGFMLGIAQILGDFNHFAHHVIRVRWPWANAEQLLAEGAAMQHCAGTFADYCRSRLKRIYSVCYRQSGQRVATFSLEYADDGGGFVVWKGDLLSGLKNAEVPQDVQVAADAVLRAYFDLPDRTFARPVFFSGRERRG